MAMSILGLAGKKRKVEEMNVSEIESMHSRSHSSQICLATAPQQLFVDLHADDFAHV